MAAEIEILLGNVTPTKGTEDKIKWFNAYEKHMKIWKGKSWI